MAAMDQELNVLQVGRTLRMPRMGGWLSGALSLQSWPMAKMQRAFHGRGMDNMNGNKVQYMEGLLWTNFGTQREVQLLYNSHARFHEWIGFISG